MLSACALCFSCSDKEHSGIEPQEDPTYFDVGYTLTRAAPGTGAPVDKDTYTIMSYRVADLAGTATTTQHVISSADQRGFYVYLEDGQGNTSFVEDDFLIPSRIRNESNLVTDYPYNAWNATNPERNNNYGQRLQSGIYKTAVLHPAAIVLGSGNQSFGSFLAVLPRDIDCPVYAPLPNDQGGLFEMKVEQNMAVYDIDPGQELYITLAKMKAYFYSSPNVDYVIESVKLMNVGSSGWFNPYTGITYPNYNTNPRSFSLVDSYPPQDPSDWKVSTLKSGTENLGQVTDALNGVGGTYDVHYLMDDEAIFATDYRGQSEGGTLYTYVKTLIMRITAKMPIPGSVDPSDPSGLTPLYQEVVSDIPVSLDIQRGKLYNFYFDVRSGIFSVTYSIYSGTAAGWDTGNVDTGDNPIGETITYGSFDFLGSGGWTYENTTDIDNPIGGVNP